MEGNERSHYRLLLLHDKSQRHQSQEQAPSATKPVLHGPELPVSNVNDTVDSSEEFEAVNGSVSTDYDADDQVQPIPITEG